MVSVRLPKEVEHKLDQLSQQEKRSKSDIIKDALEEYLGKIEKTQQPYILGEDLFGKYGSGSGELSREYKRLVREKIHAKKPD